MQQIMKQTVHISINVTKGMIHKLVYCVIPIGDDSPKLLYNMSNNINFPVPHLVQVLYTIGT